MAIGLVVASCATAGLVQGLDGPAPTPPAPVTTAPRFEASFDVSTFQKGNLHTHTNWSDGDTAPEDVYRWYRKRGYRFLAITDHNQRVDPKTFEYVARPDFALIPGEEITMTVKNKPVHVNALCIERKIVSRDFDDTAEALRSVVAEIRALRGVALVNHPNFGWAIGKEELAAAEGAHLLEIFSGHTGVPWQGDGERPSQESLWVSMLDRGIGFAAVAVDDAHRFSETSRAPPGRPGRGWVQVFSKDATVASICNALSRGELYTSTGPELRRIVVRDTQMEVWPVDRDSLIEFVGKGGDVLTRTKADAEGRASYTLRGGESYVRARITDMRGRLAWTQAYRVSP